MTSRFPSIVRLASIALTGLALIAAAEQPAAQTQITNVNTPVAVAPAIPVELAVLTDNDETTAASVTLDRPASLTRLVADITGLPAIAPDAEARCLTRAVFFEARGEPLEGQLAVAQVILNRVASGRYSASVCGVVDQPGQFTFARRAANTASADYRTAEAIAIIAQAQRWLQVAPRATAFHAARLSPGWGNMQRVSRIGNHVFYR